MLPSNNITQAIVAAELGIQSDRMSDIFISQNVNMWSRKKPYVSSRLANNTIAELEADLAANGYGLTVPSVARYPRQAALSSYIYNRPTANFRIGDFRQYNHQALPVIGSIPNVSATAGYLSANFPLTFQPSGLGALGIEDIPDLQDMYLAVILSRDNWSTTYIVTSAGTIGGGARAVSLNDESPFDAADTWQYMAVACSLPSLASGRAQNVTSSPFTGATYRPLPFGDLSANLGTFTITGAAVLWVTFNYTRTSGDVWTITPIVMLSGPHGTAVSVNITGMTIARSGGSISYRFNPSALAEQSYNIPSGSTRPTESIGAISQSSFRAPIPSLEIGDRVTLAITVTPATMTYYNQPVDIV